MSTFFVLHCFPADLIMPYPLPDTALYCTALHYTTLHYTALHYTALHYTYYTALYCTALFCTALYCTTLHYTALHYTIITSYITNSTLHYTALHISGMMTVCIVKNIYRAAELPARMRSIITQHHTTLHRTTPHNTLFITAVKSGSHDTTYII